MFNKLLDIRNQKAISPRELRLTWRALHVRHLPIVSIGTRAANGHLIPTPISPFYVAFSHVPSSSLQLLVYFVGLRSIYRTQVQ
jgi:hypothetical protein